MTGTVVLDPEVLGPIFDTVGLQRGSEDTQQDGRDVAVSWTRYINDEWGGTSPINPAALACVLSNGFGVIGDARQLLLVCQAVAATLTQICGFAEAEARDTAAGVRIFLKRE